uniref:Uncharacterized protein n=1 Tax=Romanomermis culicivorax TaxID=13658 RepID=A0A915L1R3_ROMCU
MPLDLKKPVSVHTLPLRKYPPIRRFHSLSPLDEIGSSPGKSLTRPPHGWTSPGTPIIGDRGAVAVRNGDGSMTLTSLLTAGNVSPKALVTLVRRFCRRHWLLLGNRHQTSNGESIGIPGGGPWATKWARGARAPAIGQYHTTMLTSPVVFGLIDGFTLTSIVIIGGSSGRADNGVSAETTAAAKNPILITQTG